MFQSMESPEGPIPPVLYHYTSKEEGERIMQNKTIKATMGKFKVFGVFLTKTEPNVGPAKLSMAWPCREPYGETPTSVECAIRVSFRVNVPGLPLRPLPSRRGIYIFDTDLNLKSVIFITGVTFIDLQPVGRIAFKQTVLLENWEAPKPKDLTAVTGAAPVQTDFQSRRRPRQRPPHQRKQNDGAENSVTAGSLEDSANDILCLGEERRERRSSRSRERRRSRSPPRRGGGRRSPPRRTRSPPKRTRSPPRRTRSPPRRTRSSPPRRPQQPDGSASYEQFEVRSHQPEMQQPSFPQQQQYNRGFSDPSQFQPSFGHHSREGDGLSGFPRVEAPAQQRGSQIVGFQSSFSDNKSSWLGF